MGRAVRWCGVARLAQTLECHLGTMDFFSREGTAAAVAATALQPGTSTAYKERTSNYMCNECVNTLTLYTAKLCDSTCLIVFFFSRLRYPILTIHDSDCPCHAYWVNSIDAGTIDTLDADLAFERGIAASRSFVRSVTIQVRVKCKWHS